MTTEKPLLIIVAGLLFFAGCDRNGRAEPQVASPSATYQPKFERNPAEELEVFLSSGTGGDGIPSRMADKDGHTVETPTVKDVIDAANNGYEAESASGFRTVLYLQAENDRLLHLMSAKPSTQSFVRDFACTPEFVDELPDTVWGGLGYNLPDKSGKDALPSVVPSGRRFVDIRQPEAVRIWPEENSSKYQTITIAFYNQSSNRGRFDHKGEVIMKFYGWGDFNDDGVEDIFFSVHGWNDESTAGRTYQVADLVLTKYALGGPWQVVPLDDGD